jgi:hypothetical protein
MKKRVEYLRLFTSLLLIAISLFACEANKKKAKVPKILYIGNDKPELKSIQSEIYEDTSLEVKYLKNDTDVNEVIANFKPNSIITIGGSDSDYKNLFANTFEIRKKWVHLPKSNEYTGTATYNCAMNQILTQDNTKLISYYEKLILNSDKYIMVGMDAY